MGRRRWHAWVLGSVALGIGVLAWQYRDLTTGTGRAMPARDPWLRAQPVTLYPAQHREATRLLLVLFGNDVGFWAPHRALAWHLSRRDVAVAGVDLRPLFHELPRDDGARRVALAAWLDTLVTHLRPELGTADASVVIGGHSLGAETAVWAGSVSLGGVVGVLALSPGARSHLDVDAGDLANIDPRGPGSFAMTTAMARVSASRRIALLRGQRDRYARIDVDLLRAGGPRARRFLVAFAGHSLKSGLVEPEAWKALSWICDDGRCGRAWSAGG